MKQRLLDILHLVCRICVTAYVLIVFTIGMLLFVQPLIWLWFRLGKDSEEKRHKYHRILQRMAIIAERMIPTVRFVYENPVNEKFNRPAMIVANHQSHFDLLCIIMLAPKIVIMTKDWVWKNPLYGLLIRYAEYYPASNGMESNLSRLQHLLDRGYSIMIFPEGTRSADGDVHRFHKGALVIARQLGLDLVPVILEGGTEVLNKKAWTITPGTIRVNVEPRIHLESLGESDLERTRQLRAYFRRRLAELTSKHQEGGTR